MKTVVYGGPYTAVDIPSLGLTAEKGDPVEVAEDVAETLLRQGWQEVKAKKETGK
ncbi:hypothetical protein [Streptomyces antimicrobicus]|uniref:Uncharacterized protein n=1 Tax=Streptomyces antimicrobicus TaxID=2883108 RepID=A0ABS8B4G2_9ACTN|nr:hypothetical protein [Streptomyces antimicrobicus]MCB5179505.1 hypothetical protein [Streptomyces antimicrobicus]